jgi:alpha-galactosidase
LNAQIDISVTDALVGAGIYTAQSEFTCQLKAASYQHEAMDAAFYCENNVDYVKIDDCGGGHFAQHNTSWIRFRKALDQCKHRILMAVSSCSDPTGCGAWVASGAVSADIWRTTGDIQATWGSIMNNLDVNNAMAPVNHAHPFHYNDPDMLQVGNIGLSHQEQVAHFALWCLITGPLLISTDLNSISNDSLAILTHDELIAVNQHPSGIQGTLVSKPDPFGVEVWAKKLGTGGSGSSVVVIFLNRASDGKPRDISTTWEEIGLDLQFALVSTRINVSVRDIWERKDMAPVMSGSGYVAKGVVAHSVVALKFTVQ